MNSTPTRLGLIGAGRWAREAHLPSLDGEPMELSVVARSNSGQHEDLGFERVVEHWREVAQAPDVDAVLVCSPPRTHAEIVRACLVAGKHVYCESPLALTATEANSLTTLAGERARIVAYGRPRPWIRHGDGVAGLLADGLLGEVSRASLTCRGNEWLRSDIRESWLMRQESGPPALAGLVVGMTCGLLGEVEKACGVIERSDPTQEDRAPDRLNGLLRMRSGVLVTVDAGWSTAPPSLAGLHLYGSRGTLVWEWCEPFRVLLSVLDHRPWRPLDLPEQPLSQAWTATRDFVRAIRAGINTDGFQRAVHELDVVEALTLANESETWVAVPDRTKSSSS